VFYHAKLHNLPRPWFEVVLSPVGTTSVFSDDNSMCAVIRWCIC